MPRIYRIRSGTGPKVLGFRNSGVMLVKLPDTNEQLILRDRHAIGAVPLPLLENFQVSRVFNPPNAPIKEIENA